MQTAEQINSFIEQRYGAASNILVKEPDTPSGIRNWTQEDSKALAQHLASNSTKPNLCYNLAQAAQAAGVGEQTIQAWLSRDQNALPHIKANRRIIIPHFMLISWLRQESLRTVEHTNGAPPQPSANGHYQAQKNAGVAETRHAGSQQVNNQ